MPDTAMDTSRRTASPIACLTLALAACGGDDPSIVVAVPPSPPVAGLGLQLSRVDVAAVRIEWSFDPVAAGYVVTRDGIPLASVDATSLVDASVGPGYRYCYQVTGVAASGRVVSESTVGCVTLI
jgi:hypothetical protein